MLTSDEANYSVIVSNSTASVTSSNAFLAVTIPLELVSGPMSQTVLQGANVSFTNIVSGNYLVYRWRTNDIEINNSARVTGATNSILMISNVTGSDAARYSAKVTNLFGTLISPDATLTVITTPLISSSPTNTTAIQSDDVSLSVAASGFDLSYQWWLTNNLVTNSIPGATNSTYSKLVVQTNDAGHYSIVITNLAGRTNANADLTVLVPPWIVQQPLTVTTNQGSNVTFTVTATGTTNLSYQWFKHGTNAIPGATSSTLALTNVQPTNAAGYSVLVTNIAGTNMSAWAWLSVILSGGGGTNYGWGSGGSPPVVIPSVSMISPTNTSPTNPAVYLYGPPISIRASASSTYNYVTNVVFYTGTNAASCTNSLGAAVPGPNTRFALAWTNALPGTNTLKARAWDNQGNTNDSAVVYVIMDKPPVIQADPGKTLIWGGYNTNVWLTNFVSDDGLPYSVTNISWNIPAGVTVSHTYTYTSTNIIISTMATFTNSGSYGLQLQVSDGFVSNSATCWVIIKRRPEVYFNSPTNNAAYLNGTPVVLNATAYDLDGGVTNVTFYCGTNTIGTGIRSANNSFTFLWSNAPVGTNTISANATDNEGLTSTTNVSVVIWPNLEVFFDSPTNGQWFVASPTNILLTAHTLSHVDSTAISVTFSNQFGQIGEGIAGSNSNWSLLWQAVTNGTYTLIVGASDDHGNKATNRIDITVNAMPVVSIISPTNTESFGEVANVPLTASACDPEDGTNLFVGFYYTNSFIGWATNLPGTNLYRFWWTNRHANIYPIAAVATDQRGASVASALGVFKVTPTNPPPLVWITYPTNGATFAAGSDITITAVAYGTNGGGNVTNVEFFVNEESIGSDPSSPYSITECCWKPGRYVLVARATDSRGMSVISEPVTNTISDEMPIGEGFWDSTFYVVDYPPPYYGSPGLMEAMGSDGTNIYVASRLDLIEQLVFMKWDGATWSTVGNSYNIAVGLEHMIHVTSILPQSSDLYVAGVLADEGDINERPAVLKWNGAAWEEVGDSIQSENVTDIVTDKVFPYLNLAMIGDDLYLGGAFSSIAHTNVTYIAKLNSQTSQWEAVGDRLNGPVLTMAQYQGNLTIGGAFTNASSNAEANYVAILEGNTWRNLGGGLAGTNWDFGDCPPDYICPRGVAVWCIAPCGETLFVGGSFVAAGTDLDANGVAVWNGKDWEGIGEGLISSREFGMDEVSAGNPKAYDLIPFGDVLFVSGAFGGVKDENGSVVRALDVAKATWNEALHEWKWSDLDLGVAFDNQSAGLTPLMQLIRDPPLRRFDLYVGGYFKKAGSAEMADPMYSSRFHVARWRVGYPQSETVPTVGITEPASSAVLIDPGSILLSGVAVSSYTNIYFADFYTNGVEVGTPQNYSSDDTNRFHFTNLWMAPEPGVYLIRATARDDEGLIGQSVPLVITVKSSTNLITATNDEFTVREGASGVTLPVLNNDVPAGSLKISQVTTIRNDLGRVAIGHDRSYLVYTPLPNVFGTDIFYYSVTNGSGNVDSASVTVRILSPPTVQINAPYDSQRFAISSPTIWVTNSAGDYDGTIANVVLLTNGIAYKSFTTNAAAYFVTNWTASAAGFYTLEAAATDNNGLSATSAPVTVVFTNATVSSNGPVALITNLIPTIYTYLGISSTNPPVIRDGLFDLKGQASDSDGDTVSYAVFLLRPEDEDTTASDDPNFILYYTTPYADVTPGPYNPQHFHNGGDTNGDLGVLDLTSVPNGTYDLVLRVRGGTDETNAVVRVVLDTQLKIGQFSFTEQDLVIPVSGIPLTVTRTYNSLNQLSGAFGQSWTYSLNDMDVQIDEDRTTVTALDTVEDYGNLPPSAPFDFSLRIGGGRDVTLTLPDGRRTTFYFTLVPSVFSDEGSRGFYYDAKWIAPPGVTETLTTPNPTTHFNLGDNTLAVPLTGSPFWRTAAGLTPPPMDAYDFPTLVLSNRDGTQYIITRDAPGSTPPTYVYEDINGYFGDTYRLYTIQPHPRNPHLFRIVQRSGDVIQIDDDGISHFANGTNLTRSVFIEHDAAGRITAIRDPNSGSNGLPVVKYVYNRDTGNLIQVHRLVDRNAGTYQITKYRYDQPGFPHYITSIEDPRGIPIARNEYDDSGRLTAVVDADGNRTEFVHSTSGRTEVVIDRLGHTNTFVYDLRGNVTATTNALRGIALNAYDDNGNKTNDIVYLNGAPYATNSFVYDTNLNVMVSSKDPLGHTSSFSYNQYGQLLTSTDARGNSSTNSYDDRGNLIATIDALGNATTNFYSAAGLLVGSRDAVGTLSTNYYDSVGNLIASAMVSGATILSSNTFAYDDNGNRTSSVVWRRVSGNWTGATNTFVYDEQNRIVQTIDPDGGTNTVVYNEIGKQAATIDKLGRTNSHTYDLQGRLVSTTHPDGTTEFSTYDPDGNRTNGVDRAGRPTTYVYDELNRLAQTIYADNTTNRTVYDDLGRVAYTVDARGTTNAFGYDAVGRRFSMTNAWGTAVAMTNFFGYDANGNQVTFTNGLGIATTNVFDALNRQVQTLHPDGTKISTGYDAAGRRAAETNQDGIVTLFGYDGAGRLISVTNALNKPEQMVTRYDYDESGNLIHQTDALNRTNSFAYDAMSRRIAHWMPDASLVERFSYDLAGNLIRHTNFNGTVITNQYDTLNCLTNRSAVGYYATFDYSPTGQRTNMSDLSGSTAYSYDVRDRLTNKVVTWAGGPTVTLSYGYDVAGNLTNIWSSTANGVTNSYQYDALSRLTNVLGRDSVSAGYRFDGVGNLQTVRYGNGVTNLNQYDSLNRLTNSVWKLSTSTLAGFFYQLNLSGTRTNLTESLNGNRTYAWQYDSLYRLTNENISTSGTLGYGYDRVGNRTNRTSGVTGMVNQNFTFNTNDWLETDTYDSNGNTTASGTTSYQYDPLNHVTNVNSGAVLIVYDGDGNRVKKTVGTTATYYVLDDRNPSGYVQVTEELQSISGGAATLDAVYTYGLDLVAQRRSGIVRYFLYDGHGSTRALLDTSGTVTDTYQYDAYGVKLSSSTGSTANNYLYCGEQFDPDLGFYYLRARYYKPDNGRFQTMDSFEGQQEDPPSLHKYVYSQGNPVSNSDPTGLETWEQFLGYDAEEAIQEEYLVMHPAEADHIFFGRRQYFKKGNILKYLKPDIFVTTPGNKRYLEIKPISDDGVKAGVTKMIADAAAFRGAGYKPDIVWQPLTPVLETSSGEKVFVINVGGIVFYQDVDLIEWSLIAVGAATTAKDLLPYLRFQGRLLLQPALAYSRRLIATGAQADSTRARQQTGLAFMLAAL